MSAEEWDCPASNRTFVQTRAEEFETTREIILGHEVTPRFGHTRNITAVLESVGDGTEQSRAVTKDYVIGVVSASIAMFAFFCCWMITLLLLKCIGPKRVGFFSGDRVKLPPPPSFEKVTSDAGEESAAAEGVGDDLQLREETGTEEGEKAGADTGAGGSQSGLKDDENWQKAVKAAERRLRRIRITVLFCGAVIIAMCITMIVKGVYSLSNSFGSVRDGLDQAEDLAVMGIAIINDFTDAEGATFDSAKTIDRQGGLCAAVAEQICQVLLKQLEVEVQEQCIPSSDEVEAFLKQAEDAVASELEKTRSDFVEAVEIIQGIDKTLSQYQWAFWVSATVAGLLAAVTLAIMTGVIMAWAKRLHGNCCEKFLSCMRGWLLVPIYTLLVVLGWLFSMVFIFGSTTTADFCYDSPDQNVLVRNKSVNTQGTIPGDLKTPAVT